MAESNIKPGYGFQPEVGANRYLRLAQKGDVIHIRIASIPLHKRIHWTTGEDGRPLQVDCEKVYDEEKKKYTGECKYCTQAEVTKNDRLKGKTVHAWVVLDRDDENKPKVYKASNSVYLSIKGLKESKAWGDPTTYDLEITRTEERPQYYKVVPLPEKGPLTEAEKKVVKEANYDLGKELGSGARPSKTFGAPVPTSAPAPELDGEGKDVTEGPEEEIPF